MLPKIKTKLNFLSIIFSFVIFLVCSQNTIAYNISSNQEKNISSTINNPQIIAQQDFNKVQVKITPLKNNIYMLEGEGGNIGVSMGNDGIILIDSQFAPLSSKIKSAIQEISNQPIRYLINTHYHFDHTGGNENFANDGALIIAHDNVVKQMTVPHSYPVLGMEREASSINALPKFTFNNTVHFNLNHNHIYGLHIPLAHTDGDVIIHFVDQNIIHTGDLFFNGLYPFIDTGVGGSVEGMIKGINQILARCDDNTLLIPGHGKVSNRKELIAFQDMLKIVDQRVKEGVAKNMTLEDLIKAKTLGDLDDIWGKGFLNSDQFLTIAYQGLNK